MVLLDALRTSWTIHLRALNRSPRTIHNYLAAQTHYTNWSATNHRATDPTLQTKADIEAWIVAQLERDTASSALTRYRCLQQWFRWLVEEEEIAISPMAKVAPPRCPPDPPTVLTDAQLTAIVAACRGAHWLDKRDTAVVRLLIDTGVRVTELAGMLLSELDLNTSTARVVGKGSKPRLVTFGAKTTQALDRYIRARARRPHAWSDHLWLSTRGPMIDETVRVLLTKRGRRAGVPGLHPHLFRHTFAHSWLDRGGQERDLMALAGWSSTAMLGRYGASAAAARALRAHRTFGPGDRI